MLVLICIITHIRFWKYFNYSRFGNNSNVVKDISEFDNYLHHASINWYICTFNKIWDIKYLEI